VNALLSFGYALLANDIHSAVNTVGFDPRSSVAERYDSCAQEVTV
jgi:CRISPR/Cas system-associated endonuclease Cas1